MEAGAAENVATDCSEMGLLHNPDENDTTITRSYTNLSITRNKKVIISKEECGDVSTNEGFTLASQTLAS